MCETHLNAHEARAAARAEGLELVTSNNATGYRGVFRASGYRKAPAYPFLAVAYTPERTALGKFKSAEHAALTCARHLKTFGGEKLLPGAAGGSKRHLGLPANAETLSRAAAAGGPEERQEGEPGPVPSTGDEGGAAEQVSGASLLRNPWWMRRSEERARIDSLSEEEVEARAKADGLELITSTRNDSGYAGVFKRKRRGNTADRYEAIWGLGQLERAKMGLRSSVSFGTWARPDQAALVLAQEIRRIRDATAGECGGQAAAPPGGAAGSALPEHDVAAAMITLGAAGSVPSVPSNGSRRPASPAGLEGAGMDAPALGAVAAAGAAESGPGAI